MGVKHDFEECITSTKEHDSTHSSAEHVDIINVRVTHKTAHVPLLEAVSFKDKSNAYSEMRLLAGTQESVLIQTCNRIELYLVSKNGDRTVKSAIQLLKSRMPAKKQADKAIEYSVNRDALNHLLRVTSGLESMVIGEDQVINQVWNSYLESEKAKVSGPVLALLFNRAVNVGRRVRRETGISRGAVSVGSAAVELAENLLENLNEKKILVMGAGETATLIAKAMARRCLSPIFIANRTHERAQRLAEELGGKAVKFNKLNEVLVDADVVLCATSAPHYLLTKDLLAKLLPARQNKAELLVIDISNPRNVEEIIKELPGVELYSIDDLSSIAEQNKLERQKSMQEANRIVDQELAILERAVKGDSVREIVSELLSQVERHRMRELNRALDMMGKVDDHKKRIISDLTNSVLKQSFLPIIENIRKAAENNDLKLVEAATAVFGFKNKNSFSNA